MFRIIKQRREVKFPLVYAGMLDHEDSDNITDISNFPTGLNNKGACPPAPPPPATAPLPECL